MSSNFLPSPAPGLDLALDVLPSGGFSIHPWMIPKSRADLSGRAAVLYDRREAAGCELMEDPVYDH